MPTLTPLIGRIVCARSSTTTPASPSVRARSPARSDCQSWLPRTATTGIGSLRHASASTRASSTSPCCVRSPARRTRSAQSATCANASRTRSASPEPAWMSAEAATRTHREESRSTFMGRAVRMPSDFETLLAAMRKAAGAFRDAEIPFALAGSVAVYAHGGPDTDHDVDFLVKPEDAERALAALAGVGFRVNKPAEGWLYKALDPEGALIDIIFEPTTGPVTDDLLARAETVEVYAIR